jgi:hypothetical protein
MNLRWIKRNLVAVIFVAVYVILLGAIIWLEQRASASRTEVEADLSAQQETLQRLRSLPIYPSRDNIQLLQAQRTELQDLNDSLQQAVMRGGLEITNAHNEIDFVDGLRRVQNVLSDLARKNGVLVESNFAFGFSRYADSFPCRNPPAKSDECTRILTALAKELTVIEKLTTLAVTIGVDNIVSIRRVDVEPIGSGGSAGDTLPGPLPEDKGRYRLLPFDMVFTCGAHALQTFLNNLAQSDSFFIVESTVINAKGIILSTPAPGAFGQAAPGTTPKRPVIQQHKLMLVTMRIDLVEFIGPKPTK